MVVFVDILTIIFTIIVICKNCKKFTNSALYLIYFTFVILYILPILLDYTVGFNEYIPECKGLGVSRKDIVTSLIYDLFVIYVQIVLIINRNKKFSYSDNFKHSLTLGGSNIPPKIYKYLVVGTLAAPFWMIINSASHLLFFFQWRELRIIDLPTGYPVAECLSYIGISCSIFLIFKNNKSNRLLVLFQRIVYILLLYMNICIEGKRAVLFFALCNIVIVVLFQYYFNKKLSIGQKMLFRKGGSIIVILFSIYMISSTFETHANRGGEGNKITNARVDFLRDDRVRMSIYAELNPSQMQITKHALQTLPDDLLSFFPLNFLKSRINRDFVMYQTRFTCAMSGENTSNISDDLKENYSFMTVSFLAEVISNLGVFLGLICIPFILLWFVNLINHYPSPINILIFNSFFLLNLFDFSYVSYYIQLTLILMIIYKRNKKIR